MLIWLWRRNRRPVAHGACRTAAKIWWTGADNGAIRPARIQGISHTGCVNAPLVATSQTSKRTHLRPARDSFRRTVRFPNARVSVRSMRWRYTFAPSPETISAKASGNVHCSRASTATGPFPTRSRSPLRFPLRAPLRNLLTHTVAATIAGLLIFGVGTAGMIGGYFAKNRDSVQAAKNQSQSLEQDQQDWKGRLVALSNKRQWAQTITNARTPSLEGPFLSYLGTVLPPQTILRKVSLKRTKTNWDVELTGNTSTHLSESLLLLEQLAQQLADGPYHMTVHKDWRTQLLTQTATASTQKTSGPRYRFTMRGNIS